MAAIIEAQPTRIAAPTSNQKAKDFLSMVLAHTLYSYQAK
jgi:hypothetical protein